MVFGPSGVELDLFEFGVFSVLVDYESMTAVKLVDKSCFPNLVLRRRAMRGFDARVDAALIAEGLSVAWGRQ